MPGLKAAQLKQLQEEKKRDIRRGLEGGKKALTEGNLDDASKWYEWVLSQDPGNMEATSSLKTLSNLREAQKKRELAQRQKNILLALRYAEKALSNGNLQDARIFYECILEVEPENAEATGALASPVFRAEKRRREEEAMRLRQLQEAVREQQQERAAQEKQEEERRASEEIRQILLRGVERGLGGFAEAAGSGLGRRLAGP